MGKLRPKFIVGIGGSAGALSAYKALLTALPANSGMAFVIISHMNPEASSYLAEIGRAHPAHLQPLKANSRRRLGPRIFGI